MRKQIGICICFGIALWLGGCGASNQRKSALNGLDKSQTRVSIREGTARVYKKEGEYRQENGITRSFDFERLGRSAADRAQIISDAVVSLDEIEKASVVITGNTAIVGIELTEELSDDKMIACKNEVEEKVRAADGAIDHVAVTASGDLVNRINRLSNPDTGQPAS